jgi:hypothetical protein
MRPRSQPTCATAIGVRANEIATSVWSLDPLGRAAGHRQREERVVLVLHRDDAVVVLGLAARAASGTRRRSSCGTVVNTRIFILPIPVIASEAKHPLPALLIDRDCFVAFRTSQ